MMHKFWICLGAATVALAACGPLNEGSTGAQVLELAATRIAGAPPVAASGLAVSQDEILSSPGKYMRVNISNINRWDTMARAGTNGPRVTWVDGSNMTLTLENGIIAATRGLPRDLIGANVSETWHAIRAGGGKARREHEFLTDLDSISTQLLQCSIAFKGPEVIERLQNTLNSVRFEEECQGEGLQFTNVYWVNDAGVILRSLQAVSPDAGYLQIDAF